MFSKVNEFSTHPFTNLKPEYDYNRIEYEYNLETIGKFCILPYQLFPKSSIHGWGPRKGSAPAIPFWISHCYDNSNQSFTYQQRWVACNHSWGLFHVTIVRPYGPIFDVYTSVQSHVTYLRLRGYVTTAVKKYELM